MEDILALRLLLAIADSGGFARAARQFGLSPAVATRRVAALEADLGMRLFQRSTRRVSLTEQGALVREHAQRVVDALDEAREALRGASAHPSGRLRIISRAGIGRHFIVPALPAFRAAYPDICIGLEMQDSGPLDVLARGCDVAVAIGQLADSNLVARRIAETDSHIFASPGYIATHGSPATPDALREHACLTLSAATGTTRWLFSRGRQRYDIPLEAAMAIGDADALMACARAGFGCVMIADWFAREDVNAGRLVRVLADYQVEPRGTPINLLYAGRSYVPLKLRAFIDFYAAEARRRFGPLDASNRGRAGPGESRHAAPSTHRRGHALGV